MCFSEGWIFFQKIQALNKVFLWQNMDQGHRMIGVFIRGMPVLLAVNPGFYFITGYKHRIGFYKYGFSILEDFQRRLDVVSFRAAGAFAISY